VPPGLATWTGKYDGIFCNALEDARLFCFDFGLIKTILSFHVVSETE
jgi:hypothetical protein